MRQKTAAAATLWRCCSGTGGRLYCPGMNKPELLSYLERIDNALKHDTRLYVYGSAAFILLNEPDRISLDIDVAGPYSQADIGDVRQAAAQAGLPLDPDENYSSDHIEWISQLRLCLPKPNPETEMLLWQGRKLTIKTVSPAQLIASKLIRYDEIDRSDIQYLCFQRKIDFSEIEAAAKTLAPPFNRDPIVLDNLEDLKVDMKIWNEEI